MPDSAPPLARPPPVILPVGSLASSSVSCDPYGLEVGVHAPAEGAALPRVVV